MKNHIFLADLTHTQRGIQALTFPLGTAFVAAYAKHVLGDDFAFSLFKFPDKLSEAIDQGNPRVLGLSNYSWNLELGCKLAAWAKRRHPGLIVVMGGPNFPVSKEEKAEFLRKRAVVDVYVEGEGEIGFAELLRKLDEHKYDIGAFKRAGMRVASCTYLDPAGSGLVEGGTERIKDIDVIPSPYLTGILDPFFEWSLAPMLETTRGCPFTCSFCSDGLAIKNKVIGFDQGRVRAELNYIAERVKLSDEMYITDLNFGMYKEDKATAVAIAELQAKYKWPVLIKASAGKNQTERVLEIVDMFNGSWVVGSAVQSSDKEVLKNIKRSNISTVTFQKFVAHTHSTNKTASTFCEIILGLPGDSKAKHFESIRFGMDSQVNVVKCYQAMLLSGTDMATPETRRQFGLVTKYRVMAGGLGTYHFGGEATRVGEIQEIIVGSKDLSFEDYVSCRYMSLLIEAYYNNGLSGEVFGALRAMGLSVFEFMAFLHERRQFNNPTVAAIVNRFDVATRNNLYDTHEEAEAVALSDEWFDRYLSGEIGFNEILECKAQLYTEMEATQATLSAALYAYLEQKGVLTSGVRTYLDQLGAFGLNRKKKIFDCDLVIDQSFDFDFDEIDALNYAVDPRTIQPAPEKVHIRFFHDPQQKSQISNSVRMYKNHPDGLSRLLYGQNLKQMYRKFERVQARIAEPA